MPRTANNSNNNDDNDSLADQVMAAVGQQIFSYLPFGSIINGGDTSPMLVNTIFHDSIFQYLGQTPTLDMSCQHLRKINDEQLIALVQKIVEMCFDDEASSTTPPVAAATTTTIVQRRRRRQCRHDCSNIATCPCSMKVQHINLSRCRNIRGTSLHYCLKHFPCIERILLSSASRFDPNTTFTQGNVIDALMLDKLEYIDMSGCSKVDSNGMKHLVSALQPTKLLHVDFSGASATIDDELFGSLALCSTHLESLNLAGATKVSTFGVGLISWVCRDTLKNLNLRGCEKVHLPKLLAATAFEIMTLISENIHDNHRAILPSNYVREGYETLSTSIYFSSLCNSMSRMMAVDNHREALVGVSRRYFGGYKRLEQRWEQTYGWERRGIREPRIFGKLEQLDLSLVGNRSIRLEGCIATIAWLNGGRLSHVNLGGLESVLQSDLALLSITSRGNLQSLTTSLSYVADSPTDTALSAFFFAMKNISNLDLSHCDFWDEDSDGDVVLFLATLTNLRSLRLDYSSIGGQTLRGVLTKSRKLLKLSVRGCPNITSSYFSFGLRNQQQLGLLELDCRDVEMDLSLSALRGICPHLLRLNNRCTSLGSKMLKLHRSSFLWRVGTMQKRVGKKSKTKKRKRSGDGSVALSASTGNISADDNGSCTSGTNCCTILSTGFSSANDTEQEMYSCTTCKIDNGHFVCFNCVKQCHQGHTIFSVGTGFGYCDCSIFSTCQCFDRGFDESNEHNVSIINPGPRLAEVLERQFDPSDYALEE